MSAKVTSMSDALRAAIFCPLRLVLVVALLIAFGALPASAQKTLKVAYMKHPIQEASFKMLEKWGKANGVRIIKIATAYEVFFEKISANLTSGGDQFDIMWHNDDWGRNFAKWLEPTDDIPNMKYIDRWPVDVIFANKEGRDTVVPMVHTIGTFFYRTDLIKAEDFPKTWDELVTVGKRLQKAGKVKWGFVGGMKYPHTWLTFLWSLWSNKCDILKPFNSRDNKVLAANGWTSGIDEPCTQEMVEFWWDNINVHKIVPPGTPTYTRTDGDAIFMAGDSAITMQDSTLLGRYNDPKKSRVAGRVGFAPWPVGPRDDRPRAWNEVWGWAIPKGVPPDRKKLAKAALNAMLGDFPGQVELWKSTGGPPPNMEVQKAIAMLDPMFNQLMDATINNVDTQSGFHAAYYFPNWGRVHKAYSDILIKAVTGRRQDIPKVLKAGAAQMHKAAIGG